MDEDHLNHSSYLDIRDNTVILREVKFTTSLISPQFNFLYFDCAVKDVESLYLGFYTGFRACNTTYHDYHHTMMVLLAMVRLMHGRSEERRVG